MTTTPAPCDREIFTRGESICTFAAAARITEPWVKKVAAESGQRVDWHYSGGRVNVLYLGDYTKVRAAVENLQAELFELATRFRKARSAVDKFVKEGTVRSRHALRSGLYQPSAVVLDVGRIEGRGWAVVEANQAHASGIYGDADVAPVLDCALRSAGPLSAVSDRDRPFLRK